MADEVIEAAPPYGVVGARGQVVFHGRPSRLAPMLQTQPPERLSPQEDIDAGGEQGRGELRYTGSRINGHGVADDDRFDVSRRVRSGECHGVEPDAILARRAELLGYGGPFRGGQHIPLFDKLPDQHRRRRASL